VFEPLSRPHVAQILIVLSHSAAVGPADRPGPIDKVVRVFHIAVGLIINGMSYRGRDV
jgi:hypothetical protein